MHVSWKNKIFLLTIILFQGISLLAQSFVGTTNSSTVPANRTFQVQWSLNGVDGGNFNIPSLSSFEVVSGPSTSSEVQIVNGKVSKKSTYSYTLMATKEGNYTIPSATIYVGGKKISSNKINIKVTKSEALTADVGDAPYFVEIKPSTEDGYVGQQIFLDYVIFTQKDIRSFDILNESEYDGFYASNVNFRESTNTIKIKDKEYLTKTMKRVVLFAQQTGTYTIGPSTIQLGVVPPGQKSSNNFFFRPRLNPVQVVADATTIRIADIPPSGNLAATNAVGNYNMTASIDKRSLTTDDAFTITMKVTGNGDAKFVSAPNFLSEEDFDIYDPNVTFDETKFDSKGYIHTKVFEYLAVPKKPGNYVITPEFEYFDPSTKEHKVIRKNNFRINVKQGEGNSDLDIVEESKVSLGPIIHTTKLTQNSNGFYKSIFYFLSILFCLLSIIGSYIIYAKRKKEGLLDPKVILRQKARKLALEKLSKANDFKVKKDRSAFYEEIIRAVKEYVSDKFQVPATHLTKTTIKSSLLAKGANQTSVEDLENLINTCELNLYASSSESDMDTNFTQAQNIIEQLESITE